MTANQSSYNSVASDDFSRHFCFERSSRLLTPSHYKHTFNAIHIKIHQPNLMCFVSVHQKNEHVNSTQVTQNRLGLAISKAKNKHAHERNRIKRLVREYFRLHQHEIPQGVDMVFLTKTATHNVSNDELNRQLKATWQKLVKRLSSE